MKVIVGLSGGVDSSVAALLMKQKGFEIIGCTLKMQESDRACACIEDAKKIADFLKIPHFIVDCSNDFTELVVDYFVDSYKNGITPNPCIMCNSLIKFRYLNDFRKEQNADILVTGHYAIIKNNQLYQAKDLTKDQSYFLYLLDKNILSNSEFPLGVYSKNKVREIAEESGLAVATKPDSQDICFIENNDHISFIKQRIPKCYAKGNIIHTSGKILGFHDGIIDYTIGQRKGLRLPGGPFFVNKINIDKNEIIVSDKEGIKSDHIKLKNIKFIDEEFSGDCLVKIRSSGNKVKCRLTSYENEWVVKLFEPEYGIAKGQHCVFFEDSRILGGGEI